MPDLVNPLFGDWGNAPHAKDATFTSTPVGEKCSRCEEPIVDGDVGELIPHFAHDEPVKLRPMHRECLLLGIIGHDFGVCHHTNMAGQPSIRLAALELDRRVESTRRGELYFGVGCKGHQS